MAGVFIHRTRVIRKKTTSGAAIVESVLVMVVLLLILCGFLQLFQLSVAQVLCDFAAFRAARSASVGFNDHLVRREAKLKVIPVSGGMNEPSTYTGFDSAAERFAYEKSEIPRYMEGTEYLDYERWSSTDPLTHTNYHCPYYGLPRSAGDGGCKCDENQHHANPYVSVDVLRSNESVKAEFTMGHFPLTLPMKDVFFRESQLNLSSQAELTNHASSFLE